MKTKGVRAVYNKADTRSNGAMMQDWADMIDRSQRTKPQQLEGQAQCAACAAAAFDSSIRFDLAAASPRPPGGA